MPGINKRAFVFDEWKALAETNPEAFEFIRQRMIESLIAEAEDSERLKCLQWRIDAERKRSKTPMSACVRLSSMMLDSVYGEHGLANALNGNCRRGESGQVVNLTHQIQDK